MKPSAETGVVCAGLACGYGARKVLQHVDLRVGAGKVMALLGPNGCGKSTLLKTIEKTIPPLEGRIHLCGHDVAKVGFRELAKLCAFVPQEEHMAFAFTVRQLVTMGRLPYSEGMLDTQEDQDAAQNAIEKAGCSDIADRPVTELSGGEKQRALLARALAQATPVLLLDEPTSHMDIGHQLAVAHLVRELASEGKTVLAAVHDLNLASLMADDACLLANGGVVRYGPVRDVLLDGALEDVYEVRFERLEDESGHLRLFPHIRG